MADAALEGLVSGKTHVVELGAGATGAITNHLVASSVASLTAIEVDGSAANRLIESLSRGDELPGNVHVEASDMLELDWPALAASTVTLGSEAASSAAGLVVVSNVPFGSSSKLLYSLVDAAPVLRRCVLLLQAQVAERLCATAGDADTARGGGAAYSTLSVEYALRCGRAPPELLASVPRQAFAPAPKVDTAIVRIDFDPSAVAQATASPGLAACRRVLLTAAFNRRASPLAESWAPVLSRLGAPLSPSLEAALLKRPWEVEPLEFNALACALEPTYAGGADLDISRATRPAARAKPAWSSQKKREKAKERKAKASLGAAKLRKKPR
jgi:16S rRNA (adenine1518-N6/adenine1519-N6)-dimethyltransferase